MMLWDGNVIVLWDDDDDDVNLDVYVKFDTDELSMMSDDMLIWLMSCEDIEYLSCMYMGECNDHIWVYYKYP